MSAKERQQRDKRLKSAGRRATLKDPVSLVFFILTRLAATLTVAAFVALVGYILVKGVPHLSLDLFAPRYNSENVSLLPALVNTVTMTALSLLIAVPLGICAAIYLVEYAGGPRSGPSVALRRRRKTREPAAGDASRKAAKRSRPTRRGKGSKLVAVVRATAETLSGVPSIVYGLFGLLFFVTTLRWGFSLLAGAFTLSIMILPLVMRTTEEALKSVPDLYREGSFGLGAGKLRTIFRIVLPAAVPGILAGVILAVGRIVGETAALIYTAGTVAGVPASVMDSGRTLSVHMYALSSEGLHVGKAYATAVVLLVLVLGINAFSAFIARKIAKKAGN